MNEHSPMTKSGEMALPPGVGPSQRALHYGGQFRASRSGRTIEIYSPGNGRSIGHIPDASEEDVDLAVKSAHEAFKTWRKSDPQERSAMVMRAAQILRSHADELGMLDAIDSGNPVRSMTADVHWLAKVAEMFAGLVVEVKGASYLTADGTVDFTVRQPFGVVASLAAFNHPALNTLGQAIPAILMGNTSVLKPSQFTSLASLRIAELLEGVFPPGVFNVVTGGAECGQALTTHKLTPVVTLIGSAPTARLVLRGMSERIKPGFMELGGKNAMVVCPDADVEKVADGAVLGMNLTSTSGQSCMSNSRVFLHKDIHDEALAAIVRRVSALKCGDPTLPDTQIGAMTSSEQFKKVLNYVEIGKQEGARLACGGTRPSDPTLAEGYFVEPAVFADVTQDMRIANEEIFGPVMSILRWDDEATMMEEVNSVEYGLTGSVWTNDISRAHRLAAEMNTGYVWINHSAIPAHGTPIGGWKQSGMGKVMCFEQLEEMTQIKNINIRLL